MTLVLPRGAQLDPIVVVCQQKTWLKNQLWKEANRKGQIPYSGHQLHTQKRERKIVEGGGGGGGERESGRRETD